MHLDAYSLSTRTQQIPPRKVDLCIPIAFPPVCMFYHLRAQSVDFLHEYLQAYIHLVQGLPELVATQMRVSSECHRAPQRVGLAAALRIEGLVLRFSLATPHCMEMEVFCN